MPSVASRSSTLGASDRFVAAAARRARQWSDPCRLCSSSSAGSQRGSASARSPSCRSTTAAIGGRAAAVLHGFAGYRPGRIELLAPLNSYCKHPSRPSIDMPEPSSPWSKGLPSRQPRRRSSICRSSSVRVAARAHDRRCHRRQEGDRGRTRVSDWRSTGQSPTRPTDDPPPGARAARRRLDATRERVGIDPVAGARAAPAATR